MALPDATAFWQQLFSILNIGITDYSVQSLLANFFLPLGVMFYAVYLLLEKLRIFRQTNAVSIVVAAIISLLSVRFGSIAFWIGMFGIFGLRLKGTFRKFIGLAIVFVMYYVTIGPTILAATAFSVSSIEPIITTIILLIVLVILDKTYTVKSFLLYGSMIVVAYLYFSSLFSGQVPNFAEGVWIAAIYGIIVSIVEIPSLSWKIFFIILSIVLAFVATWYLGQLTFSIPKF